MSLAGMSFAAPSLLSSWCNRHAMLGLSDSGELVLTKMASRSASVRPDSRSAERAAAEASVSADSPGASKWRDSMPVRWTMSFAMRPGKRRTSSSLVTTRPP